MNFETKFSSHNPLFLPDHNPLNSRDEFTNFLPDELHLIQNNFFNLNGSSSSQNNLISPLQSACFDPCESSTFGCPASFDVHDQHESKPPASFHAGNSSALMPLTDNMINPSSLRYNFSSDQKINRQDEGGSCVSGNEINVCMAPDSLSTSPMVENGDTRRKKKPLVRGQWTLDEDRLLVELVQRHGTTKWSQIAQMLDGRVGKQCRERWHNHLRPDIKKDNWSEKEDKILIKAHSEIGNKWANIAKTLPGRTENSIKNHWNATKRRLFSRKKSISKYPKQISLLQEYIIKTLSPETINAGCRKKKQSNKNQIPTPSTIVKHLNSSNELTIGSSDSSLCHPLGVHSYDCDDDVPDFNFDAHMLEETSIESILDSVPNKDDNKMKIAYYDHFEGKDSSEFVAYEPKIEMDPSYHMKS